MTKQTSPKNFILALTVAIIFAMLSTATADVAFKAPFGIAVKPNGSFYVAEMKGPCITKFDHDGNLIGRITVIEGYGPLVGPFDVDVVESGNIYICDTRGHNVLVLDANEKLILKLGKGEPTGEPGYFHEPHYVAANEKLNRIYVADTHNSRIQIFDMQGNLIKIIGHAGHEPGSFLFCNGISCDNEGNFFAMNWSVAFINRYNPQGELVGIFGKRGAEPGEFNDAYSTHVHDGSIWVVDSYNNRLQQISMTDWQVTQIIGGSEGTGQDQFCQPTDMDIDAAGNIYVADWLNDRIKKLDPSGKVLRIWGHRTDDMDYQPPVVYPRSPCEKPIMFGSYASPDTATVERASKEAGLDWIYYSCANQDGDWPISPSTVEYLHSKGIKLGLSIAIYHMGPRNPRWTKNYPKYYMWKKGAKEADRLGLSFFYPEVRSWKAKHLAAQAKKTNIDAIFLDYIRYPNHLFGYEPDMIKAFKNQTGKDPLKLPADDWDWLKFRAKYITLFISELRYELAQLDKHVEIGVYVGPDWKAALELTVHDWRDWVRMGIVDKLFLGIYTRDFAAMYDGIVAANKTCTGTDTQVCIMPAVWGGYLNTPELLTKALDVCIAANPDEIALYRGDVINTLNLWSTIGKASAKCKQHNCPMKTSGKCPQKCTGNRK